MFIFVLEIEQMETQNLKSFRNYARMQGVTRAYIYMLCKQKKGSIIKIDGKMFINAALYPTLETLKS